MNHVVLKIKKNDVFVDAATFNVDEDGNQGEQALTGTLLSNFHGDPDLAQYTFTTGNGDIKIQYFRKYEGEGDNFTSWTWKRYVVGSSGMFDQSDRENDNIFKFELHTPILYEALPGNPPHLRRQNAMRFNGGLIKKSKKKSKRKTNRSKKQKKQSKSRKQKKRR